ncbi:uncharacterized protein LOC142337917 isoform X2 [Convolutriloba macropyga]|uniref:uncharacterized protein LOC142337917 isoform X2 n=1 Tax=Convolutriloba macropyga TaxID=536237 RepID=UPI003F51BAE7
MVADDNISISGQHLTLESRAATLPEIKPCLTRNSRSPRSNKELIDELIIGRPTPKQFLLKWPPDHLVKPDKEQRGLVKPPLEPNFSSIPRHKWGATEIECLIREKLSTQGMQGAKQIFQVHQLPEHPETIKRESFTKVIYHLCGYFTNQQINDFLVKIGFPSDKLINFDDFIAKFRDHQVIKEGYVSPKTRKRLQDPRFNSPKESGLLNNYTPPSFNRQLTAPFAVEQIRAMLFQNRLTVEDMFPPACLKEGGLILPPQLREAFSSQGFDLEPKEFWALWRRYDLENVGAISKDKLFTLWGLDKEGRPKLRDFMYHRAKTDLIPGRESARLPTAYSIALEDLSERATPWKPKWDLDHPSGVTSDPSAPIPKSQLKMKAKEFMAVLREKFEGASLQLLKTFEKYDALNCGQLPLGVIKKCLLECTSIECEESVLDKLQGRLDIPCDENGVYFSHFVTILASRAEPMKSESVHKLSPDYKGDGEKKTGNQKDDCCCSAGGTKKPTVEAGEDDGKLETAIVNYLASPFINLLNALKEADKDGSCALEPSVVEQQIEKHLKFSLTPGNKQVLEFVIFVKPAVASEENKGKVAYLHFMKLFIKSFSRYKLSHTPASQRSASSQLPFSGQSVGGFQAESARWAQEKREEGFIMDKEPLSAAWGVTTRNRNRRLLRESARSVSPKKLQRSLDTLKELQENPSEQNVFNLPISMLEMAMQEVSKNKIHSLHKAFLLLTKNGKKHMNKLEFTDILSKIGIPLSPDEIDRIWATLPLEPESGEVSMEALVGRFTPGHPYNALTGQNTMYEKRPIPVSDEELVAQAKQRIAQQRRERKIALLKSKPDRCGKGETDAEIKEKAEKKLTLAEERDKVKEIMIRIKPQMVEMLSEFRSKLRQMDSIGHGYVTRNTIENLFYQHRVELTRKEVDLLCKAFDIHSNGNFHYLRFLQLYIPPVVQKPMEAAPPIDTNSIIQVLRTRSSEPRRRHFPKQIKLQILAKWKNLRRAFVQHDVNKDGFLQRDEFLKILRHHGIQLDEEDLYHLMSDIDTNMDGKLSYAEFLKYFLV